MLLVDRLVGPHSLQLRRPVGGEDDERGMRVRRLHHRGMKLSRGGARGGKHDGRLARRLAQAEGKERAASLVDLDEDLDSRMPLQRHGDGSRARARRDAGELDALRRQLVDERGGEDLSYIGHRIES